MTQLLTSTVVALWICIIAIIAIQNAVPVSLQFLTLRSIQMPIGLILSFSAALGLIGAACAIGVWRATRS